MVKPNFPQLQNPLFDYLSSEDKDEDLVRSKNEECFRRCMIGGIFEGLGRGVQAVSPAIKDNFQNLNQTLLIWQIVRLNRKSLTGEKVDFAKLKAVESKLLGIQN